MSSSIPIHPNAYNAVALSGLDIMKPAIRGMNPIPPTDARQCLEALEVAEFWFITPNLLGGNQKVRGEFRVTRQCFRKKIVIAVRQHANFPAIGTQRLQPFGTSGKRG